MVLRECKSTTLVEEVKDVEKLPEKRKPYKKELRWWMILVLTYFHVSAVVGIYHAFCLAKWQTVLFSIALHSTACVAVTTGAHRLWSHRSFKANTTLRALLMILFTMAFEGYLILWTKDHRTHHKFQETDADPYNSRRGLWFSHVGWLLCKKHPDVIAKGKTIDFSDLENDPVIKFQTRYYWPLTLLFALFLPAWVPVYCWGETWSTAWYVSVCLRIATSLNVTWLVNSFAHKYGTQPYDRNLEGRENFGVSLLAFGEGWHNYHHAFPWDYRASELQSFVFNMTTPFIDFCAKRGWAWDLKTVSPEVIKARALRTGDGSYQGHQEVWGWNDRDLTDHQKNDALIFHRRILQSPPNGVKINTLI